MDINWMSQERLTIGEHTIMTDQISSDDVTRMELSPGEHITFFPDGSVVYKPFIPLFVGGIK